MHTHLHRSRPLTVFVLVAVAIVLGFVTPQPLVAAPNTAVVTLPDGAIKLTASNGDPGDRFGRSVTVTGVSAIVGSPFDDNGPPNSGSAYVYTASINVITETQELKGDDTATDDAFGSSVAADINTAVIGAPNHDNGLFDDGGAAYVFDRITTTWTQQQKLLPGDPQDFGVFGNPVAIDGDIIAIGAGGPFADPGAVYVFERNISNVWEEQQKIVPAGVDILDGFSSRIAIEGDVIMIGALRDTEQNTGAVYVYTRSGDTWIQTQKLFPADAATNQFSNFGADVAIDGTTAIIGAWGDDTLELNGGSAYIFTRSGNTWTQQQKLTASDPAFGANFGITVALSGNVALVGSDDGNGAVYVFNRSGNNWVETRKLTPVDATQYIAFGTAIDISSGFSLIGATADPDANTFTGAAYVYFLNDLSALDVNNDGFITPADAIFVINRINQTNMTADVNGDGIVDEADVQAVIANLGLAVSP